MSKHTDKELSDTARQQTDRLICYYGLDLARKIISQMKDCVEAQAADLAVKYGGKNGSKV